MASNEALIEELKALPKIGEAAARKLVANEYTVFRLSHAEPGKIAQILGISVKAAKEIIAAALEAVVNKTGELPRPMTASEYQKFLEERLDWYTTGSKQMDEILGGGLASSSLVGICGPQETGKTQMVETTIVDCICNKGHHAYFIETELSTVNPMRFEEIAKNRGWIDRWDPEKLHIVSAYQIKNVEMQFYYYEVIYDMAKENGWEGGVLGIDSFNATFKRKFSGRELFPSRSQEFGRHYTFLEDMAKDLNLLIMLTYQVMETPVSPTESKGGMDSVKARAEFGTQYIPWGGHSARHPPATWISLEKTHSKTIWKAHLFGSSWRPLGECYFQITGKGVTDIPEHIAKRLMKK